jgi:5-methylcytosine-specific restriction endonuclease McrA
MNMTRKNIYEKEKGICYFCNKPVSFKDHVSVHKVLKSAGGKTCWDNMTIGHIECTRNRKV